MATNLPQFHKVTIARTRGVVSYKKGLRTFDKSHNIAQEMLDVYIKVRYTGALNNWDEIQNLKQRYYALDENYHRDCKRKFRHIRWESGWDYLFSRGNCGPYRRVLKKKKD